MQPGVDFGNESEAAETDVCEVDTENGMGRSIDDSIESQDDSIGSEKASTIKMREKRRN